MIYSENYRTVAIIPARSGSKGIPNKNILDICGKPLIAWSIMHAKAVPKIDRVIVSTDSQEIANVALRFGAEIPFLRPRELAEDLSTDLEVFKHAVDWLKKHESYVPGYLVHLRPTGPIRDIEHISQAVDLIQSDSEADSLRSVSVSVYSPYKMWTIVDQDRISPLLSGESGDLHSMPRQSLPKVYWQNGYIDIIRSATIIEKNSMSGTKIIPFITSHKIHELDYPEDVRPLAEAMSIFLRTKELPKTEERFSV